MPGSSLWLIPPSTHPLHSHLTSLIQQTSKHFSSSHLFIPHITLTSEIAPSTYGSDPQKWLDSLSFPRGGAVQVRFGELASEDIFVRKLYIKVRKEGEGSEGLKELAAVARREVEGFAGEREAGEWVERRWGPHLSLLYHDSPKVDEKGLEEVEGTVREKGVRLDGEGELGGWVGGRVVLVRTEKAIEDWRPVAERDL
ncbi:2',3'-cyclic-nucleotide 3'-phosphodiesterase [Lentithecium fluviatile CBS 122367]|uniref:2',3'-cyclic-nucleotide 3'-phosphodiesterase n=1 Tax=Lentithecium fluviatile CBS 122367 TaxID=1168545 RepID=A0A6G1JL00_9PLEO|nr:2',3'-cyclic-nucleotide 3'-phosphodiesterase [Lentithecium fluviatile CBS 122367]